MRNISTITISEGKGLWDAVMPAKYRPFCGASYKLKKNKTTPGRVIFTQGVERLGVDFDGGIWADSDLVPLALDRRKISAYFDSINIKFKNSNDHESETRM